MRVPLLFPVPLSQPSLRSTANPLEKRAQHMMTVCTGEGVQVCQDTYDECVGGGGASPSLNDFCSCFAHLGSCMYGAGCLNGTYENLRSQYCSTADDYCCQLHGEFLGCGENINFGATTLCDCEEGYSGELCNSTEARCTAHQSQCKVCDACCHDYTEETCDSCVVSECDTEYTCAADSSCTACDGCCKDYLAGPSRQVDCNVCAKDKCDQPF